MRDRCAFTLVELLVVVGIIAVLIAMLLPGLARARESANRVACSANLRTLGQAAHLWAIDHRGVFPQAWRHLNAPAGWPSAFLVDHKYRELGDANVLYASSDDRNWRTYGVTLQQWQRYGVTTKLLTCPSSTIEFGRYDFYDWGNMLFVHYQYFGGITRDTYAPSSCNWGTRPPAVTVRDKNLSNTVLGADLVFWASFGYNAFFNLPGYCINHAARGDGTRPAFQNILFGDGHVVGVRGEQLYPNGLTVTNYSFLHWANDHRFYWGQ